jgi:methionine-rich copper-binding protein CopC
MEESMSWDARPSALVHATEELLEEYSFGRIREPQLGWLEEHLLICEHCQSELDDIDEYRVFMRAGLALLERERQPVAGPPDSLTRRSRLARRGSAAGKALPLYFAWLRMPAAKSLLAAASLLALAGATLAWRMQSPVAMAPVATVKLIALRGGEDVARAPSGRPLDLEFDRRDLAADISYRAEVVNSSGREVWSGGVQISDDNLSIRVDTPLRAGAYWVRLYTSAGQLLREFGLRAG